jgi:branched-chain amino acid transport system substrate-binding protein
MGYIRQRGALALVAVTAALVGVLAASCRGSEKPIAPKDEIKIGFAGALSGPASFVGTEIKRGAEIAVDEINARGGVAGSRLRLIARDDEHTPKNTVALYRELVERQRVVAMLGASNSASMLAVTPLVNDVLKVPVICPATDATAITENDAQKQQRDNYLFRVGMYGTGQANFMVDTVVKKFGHTKVGLLTWTGGWGVTGREELRRRLQEFGLTPVADETYDDNDTDMTPQILKLRAAGAQSILNYGLVRENTFVVKTKQQLKDATPYVSAWGLSGPAFYRAAGDAAEGVFVSTTATLDGPQPPERTEFIRKYESRYKEAMVSPVFALGAYDAVYLFKQAIERGGTSAAAIRKALEDIPSFQGLVVRCNRPVFTRERHHALTEADMIMTRWTQGKQLEVKSDARGPYVALDATTRLYLDRTTLKILR